MAKSQELGGSIGNVPTNLSYFLAPVGISTPDTQAANPDTSCTDSATHQVPAGATLALQASPVNTPVTARVRFGWTASP